MSERYARRLGFVSRTLTMARMPRAILVASVPTTPPPTMVTLAAGVPGTPPKSSPAPPWGLSRWCAAACTAILQLDRLVGDGVDLALHQEFRKTLVRGQVQVGEELVSLPEPVVLLRNRLFDLHDQARPLNDLVGATDDSGPGPLLDDVLVPVVHELRYPVRLHRDPHLTVLDLSRNPNDGSHTSSPSHESVFSVRTFYPQGSYQRPARAVYRRERWYPYPCTTGKEGFGGEDKSAGKGRAGAIPGRRGRFS